MADIERVVGALRPLREAAEAALLAQRGKLFLAAGYDLVRVGLMADIPDQPVLRCVEDAVQRERQFHGAQRRSQVPAGDRDRGDDQVTDFPGQFLKLRNGKSAQVGRVVDAVQHAVWDDFRRFH